MFENYVSHPYFWWFMAKIIILHAQWKLLYSQWKVREHSDPCGLLIYEECVRYLEIFWPRIIKSTLHEQQVFFFYFWLDEKVARVF